ncbi:MAG: AAA family ATPase [Verrucomicrobiaceae bacterium]
MKTLDPSLSKSICLRGFSEADLQPTTDWLCAKGHRVVRSLGAATLVVAGSHADASLVELTKNRGLDLMPWSEFRAQLGEDPAPHSLVVEVAPKSAPLPLIEHGDRWVRVLDMRLPVASCSSLDRRFVPDASRFAHVCFDQPFVDTVHAASTGALHKMPVALEGETSASKTTAVLWLAHLLGQPVMRMNLNGQTDTGELVGRYVPGNAADNLDLQALHEHHDLLHDQTRTILHRATDDGRALTLMETYAVAANERLPAMGWRFQEGCLPIALRHGWWLLLDEMNLAEPQILERLNCVLESPASLVLTEGAGTVFGPGGDVPVAIGFRLFATLNPAEYAGRSVLSPAFRDRWSVWHHAAVAGEDDYLAMIRFLIFGEQPVVQFHGQSYQAAASTATLPELQPLPDIETLLPRLALFHTSVAKAAGADGNAPGLGRTRRERYTFTRRTLLNTLRLTRDEWVLNPTVSGTHLLREALHTFYVARLRDAGDRKAVQSLLRAAGLDQ